MYRPVINQKTASAILVVLRSGLEHVSLPQEDLRLVLLFMNKVSEQNEIALVLERLGMTAPDVIENGKEAETTSPIIEPVLSEREVEEQTANQMTTWDVESLEHFVFVYGEDPNKALQVEIAQKELVRRQEQQIRRIRPPS